MARSDNAMVGFGHAAGRRHRWACRKVSPSQEGSFVGPGKFLVNTLSVSHRPDSCLVRPSGWWGSHAVAVMVKGWRSKLSQALRLVQAGQTFHHGVVVCLRGAHHWLRRQRVSWSLGKVSSSSPGTFPGL